MPPGLECYKSVQLSSDACIIPCKGLYADVERVEGFEVVENIKKFQPVLDQYKEYKAGFINGTEGRSLTSISFNINSPFLLPSSVLVPARLD